MNYHSHQNDFPNETNSETAAFQVFIRARPLNQKELAHANPKKRLNILKKQDNMLIVYDPECTTAEAEIRREREKIFYFDAIFDESETNLSIFNKNVSPIVKNLISGYNSTIFAYGMTGAGKSFTMFGDFVNPENLQSNTGVCFYIMEELFKAIKKEGSQNAQIKLSYLEIYNEHIRDLLVPNSENLMLLEDPCKGVTVPDLTEYFITSPQDLLENIQKGNSRRIMASTSMNQFSSRSHAIIQLSLTLPVPTTSSSIPPSLLLPKLSLVDLAGSERAAATENRGLRMTEGAKINKSLLALGNCINILSDPNKQGAFVPYRDSKLTRLLKDSLGGNTKTIMIACVSPSYLWIEETLNTLKYAERARKIVKRVGKERREGELGVGEYKEMVEELRREIMGLKEELKKKEGEEKMKRPEIMQNHEGGEEDKVFEEIGLKIYHNLEENYEIRQTLTELTNLRSENENSLRNCLTQLAEILDLPDSIDEKERLTEEIKSINNIMENNEKIRIEMENALENNLAEKLNLQDGIKRANRAQMRKSITNEDKEAEGFALTCKMLKLEKLDLYSQNMELKNEIMRLNEEIKKKDKIIADFTGKTKSPTKEIKLNNSNNPIQLSSEKNCPELFFKVPDKFFKADEQISNLPTYNNNEEPTNLKAQKDKKKKEKKKEGNLAVNLDELKDYAEKIKNLNFENVKLKKRKKRYGKRDEEEKIGKINANKENHKIDYTTENIDEKQIDGQEDDNNDNTNFAKNENNLVNHGQNLEFRNNKLTEEKTRSKGSFNEVSSILKDGGGIENSFDIFIAEDLIQNIDDKNRNRAIKTANPDERSAKDISIVNERIPYMKKGSFMEERSDRNEFSLEKNNNHGQKISIQTLDMAREKVRNFKSQLNKLLNVISNQTTTITEAIKNDISNLISDYNQNKYIISSNDKGLVLRLQSLLDDNNDRSALLSEKQRSLSASITNKNILVNNLQNNFNFVNANFNNPTAHLKSENEIIEESLSSNSSESPSKNRGLQKGGKRNMSKNILNNKVGKGHFSKLNKNYGENLGKITQNDSNIGSYKANYANQKSKEKTEKNFFEKRPESRNASKSPIPLNENMNSNKQISYAKIRNEKNKSSKDDLEKLQRMGYLKNYNNSIASNDYFEKN